MNGTAETQSTQRNIVGHLIDLPASDCEARPRPAGAGRARLCGEFSAEFLLLNSDY